jgi:hypothetical protein
MELTLVDGRKAEFWTEPGASRYSKFRVRVFRNGLVIGSGYTITDAENDANKRILKVKNR